MYIAHPCASPGAAIRGLRAATGSPHLGNHRKRAQIGPLQLENRKKYNMTTPPMWPKSTISNSPVCVLMRQLVYLTRIIKFSGHSRHLIENRMLGLVQSSQNSNLLNGSTRPLNARTGCSRVFWRSGRAKLGVGNNTIIIRYHGSQSISQNLDESPPSEILRGCGR